MSSSSYHVPAAEHKCRLVHHANRERELGLDRRETDPVSFTLLLSRLRHSNSAQYERNYRRFG